MSTLISRFGLPDLGVGAGYRVAHYREVVETRPAVDWFELLSENYFVEGGSPLHFLDRVRAAYPVVPHGVGASLGGDEDKRHTRLLRAFVDRIQPPWVSDHLCFTGAGGVNAHDLLPLPHTPAMRAHLVDRIRGLQDAMGIPVVVENVSSYLTYCASELAEADFLAEVLERADCGLLLDVNNIVVSAYNHGFDPEDYLDALPLDRVVQVHLAGHSVREGYRLDTHDGPVSDEVMALYQRLLQKLGHSVSTLVEWDGHLPTLGRLVAELDRVRAARDEALALGAAVVPKLVLDREAGRLPVVTAPGELPERAVWQAQMVEMVRGARPVDGAWFTGSAALSPSEQLGVYAEQYQLRLMGALREEVPGLAGLVGAERCDALLAGYLVAKPSRDITLNSVADGLADWLAAQGAPSEQVGMAALDRAVQAGFVAAEGEPLLPESLSGGALGLSPHVTLLRLTHNVQALRAAVISGAALPELVAEPTYLVVFRRHLSMRHWAVPQGLLALLEGIDATGTLPGAVAHLLASGVPADEALLANIAPWCRELVERGLVCAC